MEFWNTGIVIVQTVLPGLPRSLHRQTRRYADGSLTRSLTSIGVGPHNTYRSQQQYAQYTASWCHAIMIYIILVVSAIHVVIAETCNAGADWSVAANVLHIGGSKALRPKSSLIQEHRLAQHVRHLRPVVLPIVQLLHVHALDARYDRAEWDMRVLAVAQCHHAS